MPDMFEEVDDEYAELEVEEKPKPSEQSEQGSESDRSERSERGSDADYEEIKEVTEEKPAPAEPSSSFPSSPARPPPSQPAFMRPPETPRKQVIVGEELGVGRAGHGTYEMNNKVYSRYVGLAEERNGWWVVIPISGVYNPKRGDGVIGRITDIIFQKWLADINSPYEAVIPLSEGVEGFVDLTKADLTKFFDYGDLIFAEIMSVDRQKRITLTMRERKCRKLRGGRLLKVTPAKVPRIIGKGGSMVEMVKNMTGTQIVVGQNGIVWIRGDNEDIAAEAILTIEARAHTSGLTDYIKAMLGERMRGRPAVQPRPAREEGEGWAAREDRERQGQGHDFGGGHERDRGFRKDDVDDIEEIKFDDKR